MRKNLAYLFLIAFICTACGRTSAPTEIPQPSSPTASIPVEKPATATPALTDTPEPSPTPDPTPTPTEVPPYVISGSELENFNWDTDWGDLVPWDQYQSDLESPPPPQFTFTDSTEPVEIFNQFFINGNYKMLNVRGYVGVNLFIEDLVLVDRVQDRPFHIAKAWVVYPGPDGHNHLYRMNISYEPSPMPDPKTETHVYQENAIRMLSTNLGVDFTLILLAPTLRESNPFNRFLAGDTPARVNLFDGIIDEHTGDDFLLMGSSQIWWKTP